MDFLHFWLTKIRVSPTDVVSSLSPPRCHLSSDRCHHVVVPCHASFSWRQDELTASASSSSNTSSHLLPSQVKTEALNPHNCYRSPFSDHTAPTLHYYKKVISTLVILLTTQSRLHFASSLTKAPRHRSSTHCRNSLSPSSHAHRHSTQRYPQ
jgi:hypothetical protein